MLAVSVCIRVVAGPYVTECFHGLDHRSGHQIAPFGRIHLQLSIAIDDRARLEQDRG